MELASIQSFHYRRDRLGVSTADLEIGEAPSLASDLQLFDDLLDTADRHVGRVEDVVLAELIHVGEAFGDTCPLVQQLAGRRASIMCKPHVADGHIQLDLLTSVAGRILNAAYLVLHCR